MRMLDLGNLLKSMSISTKNVELSKIDMYNKERRLLIDEAIRREDNEEIINSRDTLPLEGENSQANILENGNTNHGSKSKIPSIALLEEQNYRGNEELA